MDKILKNKLFMTTFLSDMISNFGDVVFYLAMMNYILQLPDPSIGLAIVTFSESFPIIVSIFIGIWADQTKNKLNSILNTLVFRILVYTIIGFLMGFEPSLWIVIVVSILNFFSDISGQYENDLFFPISLRLISNEDREAAMGLKMGVGSFLKILFQSSGAILVTIATYQTIAFINAASFLISLVILLCIKTSITNLFKDRPLEISNQVITNKNIIENVKTSLKQAIAEINRIPVFKMSIITISGINAICTAISPLLILGISENKNFVVGNSASTIALFSILFSVGSIVGSLLVSSLFKKIKLEIAISFIALMPVILFLGFYISNIYVVLIGIFITAILLGVINPKLSALVINEISENILGTVVSGMATITQIGMVAGQSIVAIMVVSLPLQSIAFIFGLLSLLILVYAIYSISKKREH